MPFQLQAPKPAPRALLCLSPRPRNPGPKVKPAGELMGQEGSVSDL